MHKLLLVVTTFPEKLISLSSSLSFKLFGLKHNIAYLKKKYTVLLHAYNSAL